MSAMTPLLALLTVCAPLQIEITNPTPEAAKVKASLQKLVAEHDLAKWLFTTKIVVDGSYETIPHSHPVLTLHSRHHLDPELLLSTFVHEQLHWHIDDNEKKTNAAIADLKKLYPKVPVGFPEGGFNERSTYEHLMICYLELAAMGQLLGEFRAFQLLQYWQQDHYTWIYGRVREERRKIGAIVKRHGLDL